MPVVVAVLFAAGCGGDGPTTVDTRPSVRFINATGVSSGGFTANGQFATGSTLASGQAMQTCSRIDPGATAFGFGAANAGGTGLSGSALVTSNSEPIVAGGSYTVVATGSATSPSLFVFGNSFSGELGTNQAAVRFANFAPNTGTTAYNYVFFKGEIGGASLTPLATNIPFGVMSTYTLVTNGANTFSVLQMPGHTTAIQGDAITLQGGSVNTMALVRNASGGLRLLHLPRCS
jgi:hypothetical protein